MAAGDAAGRALPEVPRDGPARPGVHRTTRPAAAPSPAGADATDAAPRLGGRAGRRRARAGDGRGARRAAGDRAAAVPARARRSGRGRSASSSPRSRSAARSVPADRHARGRRSRCSRAIAQRRADRHPRRLRRRRHHVDGHPAPRDRDCSAATSCTSCPTGMRDGYGLQPATIERLHAAGARLIVSVDCGIRATEAAGRARELGVDLIITDHHEPDAALPPALAVINPKRADCAYPDKDLAGVGVALKLVQALLPTSGRGAERAAALRQDRGDRHAGRRRAARRREPRHRARAAWRALSRGPARRRTRGAARGERTARPRRSTAFTSSFVLAPRLNAAGRMSSPDLALDLLLMRGRDERRRASARASWRGSSPRRTRGGRSRRPRSSPRRGAIDRRRSGRSARRTSSSSPATAGTAA